MSRLVEGKTLSLPLISPRTIDRLPLITQIPPTTALVKANAQKSARLVEPVSLTTGYQSLCVQAEVKLQEFLHLSSQLGYSHPATALLLFRVLRSVTEASYPSLKVVIEQLIPVLNRLCFTEAVPIPTLEHCATCGCAVLLEPVEGEVSLCVPCRLAVRDTRSAAPQADNPVDLRNSEAQTRPGDLSRDETIRATWMTICGKQARVIESLSRELNTLVARQREARVIKNMARMRIGSAHDRYRETLMAAVFRAWRTAVENRDVLRETVTRLTYTAKQRLAPLMAGWRLQTVRSKLKAALREVEDQMKENLALQDVVSGFQRQTERMDADAQQVAKMLAQTQRTLAEKEMLLDAHEQRLATERPNVLRTAASEALNSLLAVVETQTGVRNTPQLQHLLMQDWREVIPASERPRIRSLGVLTAPELCSRWLTYHLAASKKDASQQLSRETEAEANEGDMSRARFAAVSRVMLPVVLDGAEAGDGPLKKSYDFSDGTCLLAAFARIASVTSAAHAHGSLQLSALAGIESTSATTRARAAVLLFRRSLCGEGSAAASLLQESDILSNNHRAICVAVAAAMLIRPRLPRLAAALVGEAWLSPRRATTEDDSENTAATGGDAELVSDPRKTAERAVACLLEFAGPCAPRGLSLPSGESGRVRGDAVQDPRLLLESGETMGQLVGLDPQALLLRWVSRLLSPVLSTEQKPASFQDPSFADCGTVYLLTALVAHDALDPLETDGAQAAVAGSSRLASRRARAVETCLARLGYAYAADAEALARGDARAVACAVAALFLARPTLTLDAWAAEVAHEEGTGVGDDTATTTRHAPTLSTQNTTLAMHASAAVVVSAFEQETPRQIVSSAGGMLARSAATVAEKLDRWSAIKFYIPPRQGAGEDSEGPADALAEDRAAAAAEAAAMFDEMEMSRRAQLLEILSDFNAAREAYREAVTLLDAVQECIARLQDAVRGFLISTLGRRAAKQTCPLIDLKAAGRWDSALSVSPDLVLRVCERSHIPGTALTAAESTDANVRRRTVGAAAASAVPHAAPETLPAMTAFVAMETALALSASLRGLHSLVSEIYDAAAGMLPSAPADAHGRRSVTWRAFAALLNACGFIPADFPLAEAELLALATLTNAAVSASSVVPGAANTRLTAVEAALASNSGLSGALNILDLALITPPAFVQLLIRIAAEHPQCRGAPSLLARVTTLVQNLHFNAERMHKKDASDARASFARLVRSQAVQGALTAHRDALSVLFDFYAAREGVINRTHPDLTDVRFAPCQLSRVAAEEILVHARIIDSADWKGILELSDFICQTTLAAEITECPEHLSGGAVPKWPRAPRAWLTRDDLDAFLLAAAMYTQRSPFLTPQSKLQELLATDFHKHLRAYWQQPQSLSQLRAAEETKKLAAVVQAL